MFKPRLQTNPALGPRKNALKLWKRRWKDEAVTNVSRCNGPGPKFPTGACRAKSLCELYAASAVSLTNKAHQGILLQDRLRRIMRAGVRGDKPELQQFRAIRSVWPGFRASAASASSLQFLHPLRTAQRIPTTTGRTAMQMQTLTPWHCPRNSTSLFLLVPATTPAVQSRVWRFTPVHSALWIRDFSSHAYPVTCPRGWIAWAL